MDGWIDEWIDKMAHFLFFLFVLTLTSNNIAKILQKGLISQRECVRNINEI